jgi:hypothetical protein
MVAPVQFSGGFPTPKIEQISVCITMEKWGTYNTVNFKGHTFTAEVSFDGKPLFYEGRSEFSAKTGFEIPFQTVPGQHTVLTRLTQPSSGLLVSKHREASHEIVLEAGKNYRIEVDITIKPFKGANWNKSKFRVVQVQ